eukprot:7218730-Pyramimonas_sp.AAC.1
MTTRKRPRRRAVKQGSPAKPAPPRRSVHPSALGWQKVKTAISLAKDPTIRSCEYRACGYHLRP